MNAAVPYVFFVYVFIVTWWLLLNYEAIQKFCSTKRIAIAFVSITIAIFVFIGVATVYNLENKDCNYKEKINEIIPNCH